MKISFRTTLLIAVSAISLAACEGAGTSPSRSDLQADLTAALEQNAALSAQATELTAQIGDLNVEIDDYAEKVSTLQERIGNLNDQIADLSDDLAASEEANAELTAALAAMTAERDGLQAELDAANASIASLTAERDGLQSDLEDAQAQIEALQAQYNNYSKSALNSLIAKEAEYIPSHDEQTVAAKDAAAEAARAAYDAALAIDVWVEEADNTTLADFYDAHPDAARLYAVSQGIDSPESSNATVSYND